LNAELGAELDRYIVEHPSWAQKHIPPGAKIALQMEGHAAFNTWSRQLAKRTRSENQPVVIVCIEKLAPVRSRIIKATVLRADWRDCKQVDFSVSLWNLENRSYALLSFLIDAYLSAF
jgi:hypothetical protein